MKVEGAEPATVLPWPAFMSLLSAPPPHSFYDTPKRRNPGPLEKVPSFGSDVSSDAGESQKKPP